MKRGKGVTIERPDGSLVQSFYQILYNKSCQEFTCKKIDKVRSGFIYLRNQKMKNHVYSYINNSP